MVAARTVLNAMRERKVDLRFAEQRHRTTDCQHIRTQFTITFAVNDCALWSAYKRSASYALLALHHYSAWTDHRNCGTPSHTGLGCALAGNNERTGRRTTFPSTRCNVHRSQHCANYGWSVHLRQWRPWRFCISVRTRSHYWCIWQMSQ